MWLAELLAKIQEQTRENARAREEERLNRLVERCGEAVHLVPDTLLVTDDLLNHYPAAHQAHVSRLEVCDAVVWVVHEPLMTALQEGKAAAATVECPHCQSDEPLTVLHRNRSGQQCRRPV